MLRKGSYVSTPLGGTEMGLDVLEAMQLERLGLRDT